MLLTSKKLNYILNIFISTSCVLTEGHGWARWIEGFYFVHNLVHQAVGPSLALWDLIEGQSPQRSQQPAFSKGLNEL